MIGYYVHHHGHGHLHRARSVARRLGEDVTGLSTLDRPEGWPGSWLALAADADGTEDTATCAPSGRLHWAPLRHDGLRSRMGAISSWLVEAAPDAVVVDVSVEVAALVRLHGVPVVSLVQPGRRGDHAHLLGYDLASALVGCWPAEATGMLRGVPAATAARVVPVGGLSRFAPAPDGAARRPGAWRVVVLSGSGGAGLDHHALATMRARTPGWEWTVLDAGLGAWVDDPWPVLCDADVVVTHAGQNAIAEVAAARRPCVVLPQERPHAEQEVTASVLADPRWPTVVVDRPAAADWRALLDDARALDGTRWREWCDGGAVDRFVEVVRSASAQVSR